VRNKPGFGEVFQSNPVEIVVLQSFKSLKERQFSMHAWLNASKEQFQTYRNITTETKSFIAYLEEFPTKDKTIIHHSLPFWWSIPHG
jgi:hypothetical protein